MLNACLTDFGFGSARLAAGSTYGAQLVATQNFATYGMIALIFVIRIGLGSLSVREAVRAE
ncbi:MULTISPECIES: hypothetical protein [unclassified Arthrobacter]|uniref:hypothetical protein n=1 Tax=unclassified Arthrobacter TaxID=235627 RepID=UPI003395A826